MDLSKLDIKYEYRSLKDNILSDFYIPILQNSIDYKRAVGFFSSTALIEISSGIGEFAKNGGKMKLLTSPALSEEDLKAMNMGYKMRYDIVKKSLLNNLLEHDDKSDRERLNLLANLIADGVLDIKLAVLNTDLGYGIYHEKMGIVSDDKENKIVFSGSMNESMTAMKINYETIDVFCSWKGDKERIIAKEEAFDKLWLNLDENVESIEIPDIKEEFVKRYKTGPANYDLDSPKKKEKNIWINKPNYVEDLFDYQKEAIKNWKESDYKGIFDMATGTGKTLTALGGLSQLAKDLDNKLGIFVVCPYQHLVEQWVEDIEECGVRPLKCYSAYNWKREFENTIRDFNMGIVDKFFVVTTNMTFVTEFFQKQVDKLSGNICLVVDEAHNFGTQRQIETMKDIYKYRLALSATIERYGDEYGTSMLYKFFGDKCIEYNLEEAINDDRLTRYYYYPIPISLTERERDEYDLLSKKIARYSQVRDENKEITESTKMLLIQRARIIAGAQNKIPALCEIIKDKYLDKKHMLVYCGSATSQDINYIEGRPVEEEKRQIEIVMDKLGNELNMRVSKFTSEEDSEEREIIKENFKDGDMIQALIAIRCLDEGVDIPSIKTAFILASSTNPKEYIQRRGRVLRKAEGKNFAEIYDFITLPEDIKNMSDRYGVSKYELGLIQREFERVHEFAKLSENSMDSHKLETLLREQYDLDYSWGDI